MKTMSDFKRIIESNYPDNFRGTNYDDKTYERALADFDNQLSFVVDATTPAVAILKGMFETSLYDECVAALKEYYLSQISLPETLEWQDKNVQAYYDGHIQKFVDALLA